MTSDSSRPLNLSHSYPCPLCRQGELEAIALMDAFACKFCRHILSADVAAQQVQVVDSSQPLTWTWNGQRWRLCRGENAAEMSAIVVLISAFLIVVPAGLVWLSGTIFPPLEGSQQLPFSSVWAIVTAIAHGAFVVWLLGEYYQIPLYIATRLRVWRRRWRQSW